MKFSNRYPLWMVLPPLLIGGPLAFFFLTQVVQMTLGRWSLIISAGAVAYLPATWLYWRHLTRITKSVEDSLELDQREHSIVISDCLVRTEKGGLIFWPVTGATLSALIGFAMTSSFHGVATFVESSLIVSTIAMAWTYWCGKRLLRSAAGEGVYYRAQRFSFRTKIAMVFVGFFFISTGAMVQLVSARVSTTLETEAVEALGETWTAVLARVDGDASVARIGQAQSFLPDGIDLHLVDPEQRTVTTGKNLTATEVDSISEIGSGNSLDIESSQALLFRQMGDAIVVLSAPIGLLSIARDIEMYAFVVSILTALVFLVAVWFLSADITTPIDEMIAISERMAAGDFAEIGSVFSDDEVGALSGTLFDTRENLRRLLRSVGRSGESVTRGVRVIEEGTDSIVRQTSAQRDLTEQSGRAVREVRDVAKSILSEASEFGDLTRESASRAVELQSSAEEVARNMEQLFASVESTSSSVLEINSTANETNRRAEVLAGVGEEVLTYVSEMDSTVEQFRQSTRDTAEMSQKVREVAAAGAAAVADTVKGIEEARQASRRTSDLLTDLQRNIGEINVVVKVIEELTENTNLLSLNASIIAAQAGDRDLGFSVVADEIRQLADRTRQSTGEIHQIIRVIGPATSAAVGAMKSGLGQVEKSVTLSEKASSALSEIGANAQRSSEMTGQIATALEQHAAASNHLLKIASSISEEIAAISRATREQAEATLLLAREAETVRDIASQVRRSTEQQTMAAAGISEAMTRIAVGEERIRERLQSQLESSDRITEAAERLEAIARRNDEITRGFRKMTEDLAKSGRGFEEEFSRFQLEERRAEVREIGGGTARVLSAASQES